METLPVELQELLLALLSGDDLLVACGVCRQWNSIISGVERVWRAECQRIGTGLCVGNETWKELYVRSRRRLSRLEQGSAFRHDSLVPESLRGSHVRGMALSGQHLLVAVHNKVGVWWTQGLALVGMFPVPYKLTCLTASLHHSLVGIGQHSGVVSVWELGNDLQQRLSQPGHQGAVTSMSLAPDLQLMCSGSTDLVVRVWHLLTGAFLWSCSTNTPSLQVAVHAKAVVVSDFDNVRRFSSSRELLPRIALTGKRFEMCGDLLACCSQDSLLICSVETGLVLLALPLGCSDMVPVALGTRFVMLANFNLPLRKHELVVLDLKHNTSAGTVALPLCRFDFFVSGSCSWMCGLGFAACDSEVVFVTSHTIQATACLNVFRWRI